jgi:hypothetical protein
VTKKKAKTEENKLTLDEQVAFVTKHFNKFTVEELANVIHRTRQREKSAPADSDILIEKIRASLLTLGK